MKIVYAPRGILQIDDARFAFRPNFSGAADKYNREGDRNFTLLIPTLEQAEELRERGWNIKEKPPRDMDEEPLYYLTVKVKFSEYGPNVFLKTGNAVNRLDEKSVGRLDRIRIASMDMDIRPYDWEVNGKTGRTAYLQSIHVEQAIDRFAARYEQFNDEPEDDDLPFDM